MKLVPVTYPDDIKAAAYNIRLVCKKCLVSKKPFQMLANLDGEPFKDYQCKDCNETVKENHLTF